MAVEPSTLIGIALGISLSAASGFRAFVPLLVLGIAARNDYVALAPGMEWIATEVALVALATATVVEVLAYYTPWLDNLLDTIATPAAVVAGTVAVAAVTPDLPPLWRWALAIIAGGGTAGLIQAATVLVRLSSTVLTWGLGNPVVATGELIGAILVAVLALLAPLLALVLVAAVALWAMRRIVRRWRRRRGATPTA